LVELPASGRLDVAHSLGVPDQTARVSAVRSESVEEESRSSPAERALRVECELQMDVADEGRTRSEASGCVRERFAIVDRRELASVTRSVAAECCPCRCLRALFQGGRSPRLCRDEKRREPYRRGGSDSLPRRAVTRAARHRSSDAPWGLPRRVRGLDHPTRD